jgi:hypothetical protein
MGSSKTSVVKHDQAPMVNDLRLSGAESVRWIGSSPREAGVSDTRKERFRQRARSAFETVNTVLIASFKMSSKIHVGRLHYNRLQAAKKSQ